MSDIAPKLPRLPSPLEDKKIGVLAHDAAYTDMRLSDVVWSDQHADGVHFETVRMANVDLSGARLEKLRMSDGELTRCNLANLHGLGAQASRVVIEGSRLTGISLTDASLCDVTVRNCRADLASFASPIWSA